MFTYFTLDNLWKLIQQILDIGCVWALVYYCMKIVKNNSRTIQIFKGVLLIIIIRGCASILGLHTIANLADSIMNWGVVAIFVIFQPEIRSILEKIGKTSVFSRISTLTINERENLVDELVKACAEMSKTKTGALISIEQGHSLSDFIKTGTPMNSAVSSELLCSIFQYGTPLHDGAVIIQGVKIACAAAYFPPTTRDLPTSYGARHRAAVGISEITDSITIIVSEETGNISVAEGGKLSVISETSLREFLMNVVCQQVASQDQKEQDDAYTKKDMHAADGKKPGVFAHYFKGKNKRTKEKAEAAENKYTKKKKEEMKTHGNEDAVVVDTGPDKLKIEDLAQDEGLDQLFENIVADTTADVEKHNEHDEKTSKLSQKSVAKKTTEVQADIAMASTETKSKPKRRGRKPKAESETALDIKTDTNAGVKKPASIENAKKTNKKKVDGVMESMAQDLFDDVIEPEAIVLHYEKADEDDTFQDTKKEGSDS